MIELEIKNYNMILTEKQQKYKFDHQVELINMNILHVKKYYQIKIVEQAKFPYSPSGKTLEKQPEK